MKDLVLEIIACTVEDAVEAEKGGANRLEVISHFEKGGLTPVLDMVREIKTKVSVPLRVMLRESEGYQVSGEAEIEKLCQAAWELNQIGVDGIVLGFLRGDEIDLELTRKILDCAPNLKATFHHAFEETRCKFSAIEKLKNVPQIDRILSHGDSESWTEKFSRLEDYAKAAQPEIKILAGGGIDAEAVRVLREKTSITEFHTGSAARAGGKVDKSRVEKLVSALREDYG